RKQHKVSQKRRHTDASLFPPCARPSWHSRVWPLFDRRLKHHHKLFLACFPHAARWRLGRGGSAAERRGGVTPTACGSPCRHGGGEQFAEKALRGESPTAHSQGTFGPRIPHHRLRPSASRSVRTASARMAPLGLMSAATRAAAGTNSPVTRAAGNNLPPYTLDVGITLKGGKSWNLSRPFYSGSWSP